VALIVKDAQGFGDTRGKLYATLSVTDTPTGSPTFYWGDAHFYATNVHGGPPVSAVVSEWGELPDLISSGSSRRGVRTSIALMANEYSIPSNGTTRKQISEWLRILPIRGAAVSVYQWNDIASDQTLIWTGYVLGVGGVFFDGGVPEIELLISSDLPATEGTQISDIVDRAAFTAAPQESVGAMISRAYGAFTDSVISGGSRNEKGYLGYPMPGIGGVIVDENQATAKVTIRFAKNDGTDGWFSFTAHGGGANPAAGDLWIYDPSMNAYGLVSGASYTATSDSDKLDITVDRAPKVWFFLRPSAVGTSNAANFTHMNRLIDSDATNSEDSTGTDYIWSMFAPAASVVGNILDIRMIIDAQNINAASRTIRIGLYNSYLAGYFLAAEDFVRVGSGARSLSIGTVTPSWFDFKPKDAEFKAGRFLQTNAGVTLDRQAEMRAEIVSAGKDGVRMYGMALAINVEYPWVPLENLTDWFSGANPSGPDHNPNQMVYEQGNAPSSKYSSLLYARRRQAVTDAERRAAAVERLKGTQFFVRGSAQKDDGSGTYTGSAGGAITGPAQVAHHLIAKVRGKSANVTAGTLGNFVDPRSWGAIQYLTCLARFGPDPMELGDALSILESKFPVRFHEEDGVWQLVPDDMNPHSSRFYRSTSEVVDITSEDIEAGSFRCGSLQLDDLVNKSVVAFSHGFPSREPGSSYIYNNPVSQTFFGVRNAPPIGEPWAPHQNLETAPVENSTAGQLALWYGRRSAWPRLYPSFMTRQKFYDLKKGHIVRIRGLEDRGIPFPAYRGGLLLYHYQNSSSATSNHDGGAYVAASGNGEMYVCTGSQSPQLDFNVSVAAGYTTVASGWEYLNGGSWTALSSVVNADALKSTGAQTMSHALPSPWLWTKEEITINGALRGPGYWRRMKYTTATATGTSASRTTYPPDWYGRLFEVIEATRVPASATGYDRMRVRLQEVM
jgi:hypothetical protein